MDDKKKELKRRIKEIDEEIRAICYAAGYIEGKFDQGGYQDDETSDEERAADVVLAKIKYHEDFGKD